MRNLLLILILLLPLTAGANPEPKIAHPVLKFRPEVNLEPKLAHPLAGKKKHTEEEIRLTRESKFHLIAMWD